MNNGGMEAQRDCDTDKIRAIRAERVLWLRNSCNNDGAHDQGNEGDQGSTSMPLCSLLDHVSRAKL